MCVGKTDGACNLACYIRQLFCCWDALHNAHNLKKDRFIGLQFQSVQSMVGWLQGKKGTVGGHGRGTSLNSWWPESRAEKKNASKEGARDRCRCQGQASRIPSDAPRNVLY